tara:strand:+ start:225 stop:536 length:312 start_codon:yes stop_codon:yes gene_type:complete
MKTDKIYCTNFKETTGVGSLTNQKQSVSEGKLFGTKVSHSTGTRATKVSWFKVKNWLTLDKSARSAICNKIKLNTDLSKSVEFTEPTSSDEDSNFYGIKFLDK